MKLLQMSYFVGCSNVWSGVNPRVRSKVWSQFVFHAISMVRFNAWDQTEADCGV